MVLRILCIIYSTLLFSAAESEGLLLEKYESRIKIQIKKAFDLRSKDVIEFDAIDFELDYIEAYLIKVNQLPTAKLFLKEVQACSLNGCIVEKKMNNNIGSEYYDISVLTNIENDIQSIKVMDYFSDYGYEIASRRYLSQYEQRKICTFRDNPNQVDGISGATISYNGLVNSLGEMCLDN